MAKIPLLECLTRHSYRESLEKSSSSTQPKTEDEPDGKAQTSPQSAILSPTEVRQDQKSSSSGESTSPGRAESSGASGLQEALEEEKGQEETEKTDAPSFNVTLLDWINVQDRPNDVEAVVRKCFDSINRVSGRSSKKKPLLTLSQEFYDFNQSDFQNGQCFCVFKARFGRH